MADLRESEKEKIALEHEAAKLFMRLYEKTFAITMRHIWHNTPSKPDVSCYLDGMRLDLEIAHLYASEAEAMAVLGRSLSITTQREIALMAQTPDCDHLINALNRLLMQKYKKRYDSERVWLVIRNASPNWHQDEIKQVVQKMVTPKEQPFEEIWIISDFFGTEGLYQIYPG